MIKYSFKDHNNISMKKVLNKQLILFIPLLILNIISLFNMSNAKLISDVYNDALLKQIIWFVLGYLIIFLLQKFKLKKVFKYSSYFYFLTIFLLILVLFLGADTNGAKCWLNLFGFSFQPSELAKLSLALYLTHLATNAKIKNIKAEFFLIIKLFIITLIPSILVFLEPDTGAIINFLIILFVILIMLKLNKWWYITGFSLIILIGTIFIIGYFYFQDFFIKIIGTSLFYRMDRIINFANGNSYQLENALITIGATSLMGVGLGKILLYIPEAPTDFFFAFTLGNYGLISGIIIIIAFIIIDFYLIHLVNNFKNNSFKIFSYTYLGILFFHQIYNISMNLGLLPIMGIPLPFLSYGGTNTLINYLFLGIILNFQNIKEY